MFLRTDNPRTMQLSGVKDYLFTWLESFLIGRKAQELPGRLVLSFWVVWWK
jgi:hypothetical protein